MVKTNILFYDIKTRIPGLSTSPNTWRVRLVLDYKRLDYETVWSESPDIEQTCIAAGIPPLEKRQDGSPRYTCPAIVDFTRPEAPVRLTDSRVIIDYLETTYPDPDPQRALFPKDTRAFQALAFQYAEETLVPLEFALIIQGMFEMQTDRSRVMYRTTLEPMRGMAIEEMTPKGEKRVATWRKVRAIYDSLSSFIDSNGTGDDGLFFLGRYLCFFDLHLAARLISMKLSIGEEEFQKEMGSCGNGRWVKLLDASADLMKNKALL